MTVASAPQWGLFTALTVFVLGTLLALARASQRAFRGDDESLDSGSSSGSDADAGPSHDDADAGPSHDPDAEQDRWAWGRDRSSAPMAESGSADAHEPASAEGSGSEADDHRVTPDPSPSLADLPARQLLANVVLSHGLLAGVVIGGAWITEIPATALGLATPVDQAVVIGGGLGIGLYGANEVGTRLADRFDVSYDEKLRETLAPETRGDWLLLLGVVLPVIAGFEELLFRGAVIGVVGTAYGIDPWLLAVGSSALFGYGHGAQGHSGIAVTAGLGFVLAAAFILSESLVVVIVAHYLVNALEFIVHER